MLRIFYVIVVVVFALSGCNQMNEGSQSTESGSETSALVIGKKIELVGFAAVLPNHSEKQNGQGISTANGEFLFSGQYDHIPDSLLGLRIKVIGVVRENQFPMFEHPNDGSPAPAGIPVPNGTDIEKESIYFTIENPSWELDD